jgi:hypothetical protein
VADFFLRAKHWQIFALTWGIYGAGQVTLTALAPPGALSLTNNLRFILLFEVLIFPFVLCFMGWFWSMGSFLYSLVKPGLRLNLSLFRAAVAYTTLYLLTAVPFFLKFNGRILEAILIPMHLLAMLCLIYVFYFVAKSLVLTNKRKDVTLGDYVWSLVLLWASFLGVWVILTRWSFCTKASERVYITDSGCEIECGGTRAL